MGTSFLPRRDSAFDVWFANFKYLIASDAALYGLTPADAVVIADSYTAWHAAYVLAINPATRTRCTVATKDLTRTAAEKIIRRFAAIVRVNPDVSGELKINLGLRVAGEPQTPIAPPSTCPFLGIREIGVGTMELSIGDVTAPGRKAKPAGVTGLLLFRVVADTSARDPESATFHSFVSRSECTTTFQPSDRGKVATYFGRWTNAKGELGPWSAGTSVPVAA